MIGSDKTNEVTDEELEAAAGAQLMAPTVAYATYCLTCTNVQSIPDTANLAVQSSLQILRRHGQ